MKKMRPSSPFAPPRGEVAALAVVEPPELPIDPPEIEPGGERERPVARLLHRLVAVEREAPASRDRRAAKEREDVLARRRRAFGAPADLVEVESARDEPHFAPAPGRARRSAGPARDSGRVVGSIAPLGAAAKEAAEAVEPVVPVVVAGDAEEHARPPVAGPLGAEHFVPRRDDAALDLVGRGHRVRGVAAEEEHVASRGGRGGPPSPSSPSSITENSREHHSRDGLAHVAVVAGVGHEIDPQRLPAERFEERRAAASSPPSTRSAFASSSSRLERAHPVARIDRLAGDRGGDEVTEVPEERRRSVPSDRVRRVCALLENERWRAITARFESKRGFCMDAGTTSIGAALGALQRFGRSGARSGESKAGSQSGLHFSPRSATVSVRQPDGPCPEPHDPREAPVVAAQTATKPHDPPLDLRRAHGRRRGPLRGRAALAGPQ